MSNLPNKTLNTSASRQDFFSYNHHLARRRKWYETFLGRGALVSVIIVILHIPFWFMLEKHPSQENSAVTDEIQPQLIILPPFSPSGEGDAETGTTELGDIYAWIRIVSPRQLLYPDWAEGFSQYNRRQYRHLEPALPRMSIASKPIGRILFASKPLFSPGGFADPSLRGKQPFVPKAPPRYTAVQPRSIAHRVYWRRQGFPLTNPPVLSTDAMKLWRDAQASGKLNHPTLLEISALPNITLPRVIIRKSCGISELDRAARDATVKSLTAKKTHAGDIVKTGIITLEVDWNY